MHWLIGRLNKGDIQKQWRPQDNLIRVRYHHKDFERNYFALCSVTM